jgi:protein-L-isoaspartate(D-aspartate) O-methyltransferase
LAVDELDEPRRLLVEELRRHGIVDERVLNAVAQVRRELFVPRSVAERAYENVALPIGLGQTISQPYVVALMTQELGLTGAEHVLEVGTGSGYQAAILASLADTVVSVERVAPLLASAQRALEALGIANVELHLANGTLGWPAGAPYDRIIVTAAGPDLPAELLDQLAPGGRLVMPIGTLKAQRLVLVRRTDLGFEETNLGGVRFVPLVGEGAWSASSLVEFTDGDDDDDPPI